MATRRGSVDAGDAGDVADAAGRTAGRLARAVKRGVDSARIGDAAEAVVETGRELAGRAAREVVRVLEDATTDEPVPATRRVRRSQARVGAPKEASMRTAAGKGVDPRTAARRKKKRGP